MPEQPERVNLLSLDGGGIRGISELAILDEIMRRVQAQKGLAELPRPCEYFHLIGGSGTGGLVAIMLGRLKMTTEEALEKYNDFASHTFSTKNQKRFGHDGMFKASIFEQTVKKMVRETVVGHDEDDCMLDDIATAGFCKVFVCAVPRKNVQYPRRFRTYRVQKNESANCKIWEAARATTAEPEFFKGIKIQGLGGIEEHFIGGGLTCNNPTREVLDEAQELYGVNQHVGVLVSVGTGHPGTIGLPKPGTYGKQLTAMLKKIAYNCEAVAKELLQQYINLPIVYFRFNVTYGAGQVSFEEWKRVGEIITHTRSYLQDPQVSDWVDSVVQCLCGFSLSSQQVTLCGHVQISSTPPSQPMFQPTPSGLFTGQKVYLEALKNHFGTRGNGGQQGRSYFLLHGMGGIGKTQICLKFLEEDSN